MKDARCSQVKIYSSLPPRLIAPLARAAHEAGMSVTGHVPDGIGAVHAVEAGMDQINHLQLRRPSALSALLRSGREAPAAGSLQGDAGDRPFVPGRAKTTLEFLRAKNVVIDPTMALAELGTHTSEEIAKLEPGLAKVAEPLKATLGTFGVPREQAENAHALWQSEPGRPAGASPRSASRSSPAPIRPCRATAFTGRSRSTLRPGFTPIEAIQAATIVPARAMKREKESRHRRGRQARRTSSIVDGDPLADIRNLRRVSTVVKAGRAYDTAKLWRMVGFQP